MILTILQGPPASGKSTLARKLQAESPNDTVIVCRDSLRHARGIYWVPEQESYISMLEDAAVDSALNLGFNVIIDATNLNPKTIRKWETLATIHHADVKYIKLETPLDECIRRNQNPDREHKVPEDTIKYFFNKYKL